MMYVFQWVSDYSLLRLIIELSFHAEKKAEPSSCDLKLFTASLAQDVMSPTSIHTSARIASFFPFLLHHFAWPRRIVV